MSRLIKLRDKLADDAYFKEDEPEACCAAEKYFIKGFDAASAEYEKILKELQEALEFVSMPITSNNPTVEGLLESFSNDQNRAIKALSKLRDFRGEYE